MLPFEDIAGRATLIFTSLFLRYLLFAGGSFLVVYIIFRHRWLQNKIQKHFPAPADYLREFRDSSLTILIFTAVGWLVFHPAVRPHTLFYFDIAKYGWLYFFLSIGLSILLHDAYFYWTHRLMHWRPLYRIAHATHHRSTNPSPWAAFAFHPLEALIEAGILVVFAFALPLHPYALVAFLFFMTFFNVYGHLGYEFFPRRLTGSPIGRWLNTSTNHNMHHRRFEGNYAIYFRFWDVWMKTTQKDYPSDLAAAQAMATSPSTPAGPSSSHPTS